MFCDLYMLQCHIEPVLKQWYLRHFIKVNKRIQEI